MADPNIRNHINQWSGNSYPLKVFLNELLKDSSIGFPKTKADARSRFRRFLEIKDWSENNYKMLRYFKRMLATDPQNVPGSKEDAVTHFEAYLKLCPDLRSIELADDKPKMEDLGSDTESERGERLKILPSSNSKAGTKPVRVFCGGGKHCGYEVSYDVATEFTTFPAYCDGFSDSHPYHSRERRVNHKSNWDNVVCVMCRNEIGREHLEWVLKHFCCKACGERLHGGVITSYGLVLH